jgi:hypothetical protein
MKGRSYELTFETRSAYLYARVTAPDINEQMSRAYLGEIARECSRIGVERLMIYRDIPAVMTTTTTYFAATHLLEIMPHVRTAFVNPYASNEKILHFGVTVGVNRGENHEVFNDEESAERWLLR